jgi:hypothetical protein
MSPSDAKHVEAMAFQHHGVRGMAGSLGCSHVPWTNGPVANHGQLKGKKEVPSVMMEGVSDYHLFAWHAVVGYAGTFNDINARDSNFCTAHSLTVHFLKMILSSKLQEQHFLPFTFLLMVYICHCLAL